MCLRALERAAASAQLPVVGRVVAHAEAGYLLISCASRLGVYAWGKSGSTTSEGNVTLCMFNGLRCTGYVSCPCQRGTCVRCVVRALHVSCFWNQHGTVLLEEEWQTHAACTVRVLAWGPWTSFQSCILHMTCAQCAKVVQGRHASAHVPVAGRDVRCNPHHTTHACKYVTYTASGTTVHIACTASGYRASGKPAGLVAPMCRHHKHCKVHTPAPVDRFGCQASRGKVTRTATQ